MPLAAPPPSDWPRLLLSQIFTHINTPVSHTSYSSCSRHVWRRNRHGVPKCRHIKFRRWVVTQKKEYDFMTIWKQCKFSLFPLSNVGCPSFPSAQQADITDSLAFEFFPSLRRSPVMIPLILVQSQIKDYAQRSDMQRYVRKNFACVLYSGTLWACEL